MGVNEKDIVICGRSIGSGPAVYLSANRNPGALILISPFKSLQQTAGSILGFMKFIIKQRFDNINLIKNVTCPLLLVHGQKDDLIPFQDSLELAKNTGGPYDVILPEKMDHNKFDFIEDFMKPILRFLGKHFPDVVNNDIYKIIYFKKKFEIKSELFEIPEYILDPDKITLRKKDYFSKLIRKIMRIES